MAAAAATRNSRVLRPAPDTTKVAKMMAAMGGKRRLGSSTRRSATTLPRPGRPATR